MISAHIPVYFCSLLHFLRKSKKFDNSFQPPTQCPTLEEREKMAAVNAYNRTRSGPIPPAPRSHDASVKSEHGPSTTEEYDSGEITAFPPSIRPPTHKQNGIEVEPRLALRIDSNSQLTINCVLKHLWKLS